MSLQDLQEFWMYFHRSFTLRFDKKYFQYSKSKLVFKGYYYIFKTVLVVCVNAIMYISIILQLIISSKIFWRIFFFLFSNGEETNVNKVISYHEIFCLIFQWSCSCELQICFSEIYIESISRKMWAKSCFSVSNIFITFMIKYLLSCKQFSMIIRTIVVNITFIQ